jgi:hypothetical protein
MSNTEDRGRLATYVTERRRALYGTVENALRESKINRATWQRIEAGKRVRDDKLAAAEKALHWQPGDAWRVMAGQEPRVEEPVTPEGARQASLRERVIEDPVLTPAVRRAMLALLDANEERAEPGEGRRSG